MVHQWWRLLFQAEISRGIIFDRGILFHGGNICDTLGCDCMIQVMQLQHATHQIAKQNQT